jgi:hypothetical protein
MLSPLPQKGRASLMRLSTGCFTVDRLGQIVASTLPQGFPPATVQGIAQLILATFRGAEEARVPLLELVVNYSAFILTARELRGGAIVFLSTRSVG